MGERTQIATIALSANGIPLFFAEVAEAVSGIIIADPPVMFLSDGIVGSLSFCLFHGIAAVVLSIFGIANLFGWPASGLDSDRQKGS